MNETPKMSLKHEELRIIVKQLFDNVLKKITRTPRNSVLKQFDFVVVVDEDYSG